ncbi:MAG: polymerase subunit delta, partial [Candidatus Binatota bacterium]|nr:polymerase subunit delta [Candidatus Binatota bacterium]
MIRLGDVLGQDEAVAMLRDGFARTRLHHSLLFVGPRGVGKHTTARALAAALFCAGGGADACGECVPCRQVIAGTHPDLATMELPPVKPSADPRERRKRALSIDQVREMQAALGRRPIAGTRRVAIVDDAETLSEEAQNALLKTLEEPPPESFLILVSATGSALRPTVRSRCQRVTFRALDTATLERALIERFEKPAEEARELAAHAEGSVGRALSPHLGRIREATAAVDRVLASLRSGYRDALEAAGALEAIEAALARPPEKIAAPVVEMIVEILWKRLRRDAAGPLALDGGETTDGLTAPEK